MKTSKTILITGATTGIGRFTALHLARRGHHVIATGRNTEALETLEGEAKGLKLDVVRLDVTDAKSIAEAAIKVNLVTSGKGIDVLVNNAGYGLAGAIEEITDVDLRAQFDTNVFGLMAVTRAFLPQMKQKGEGRILNVSSVGGKTTFPLFGAYHATKYAVEALSDAMRLELAPFGIKVVVIEPGPIKTEFGARTMNEIAKYRSDSSPYASVYAKAEMIKNQFDKNAVSPLTVARAMERAITSRRPWHRYVAPFYMSFMLWFLAALPVSWSDALMRKLTGLTRKGLREGKTLASLAA